LAQAQGWERVNGPLAVLACEPSEEHVLPLIALGIALAERRRRISYLGAATPVDALCETVLRQEAMVAAALPARRDRRRPHGAREGRGRDRIGR